MAGNQAVLRRLQAKLSVGGGAEPADAPQIVADSQGSPGRPLDRAAREFFEPRFGRDFSEVRIHAGERPAAAARAISARAFTLGLDITFGDGEYAPDTSDGRRLLAHELTHVVQQGRAESVVRRGPKKSSDEMHAEIRELLDHTPERFNHYATKLERRFPNAGDRGRKAAEYLQKDFVAVFGEGVDEVNYSLLATDHRIDLYVKDYNLGIELKLSGGARAEQRRVFMNRAWGSAAAAWPGTPWPI